MKLQIAVIAVVVFLAVGLYLYINPVERAKPLFHKSGESLVPNEPDDIPTQQEPKRPERGQPKHFYTIVVVLQKHLPTADS